MGFDCQSGQTFLLVAVFSIGGVIILTDSVSRTLLVGTQNLTTDEGVSWGGLTISAINDHIETNNNGNKATVYLLDSTLSLLHSRQFAPPSRRVS